MVKEDGTLVVARSRGGEFGHIDLAGGGKVFAAGEVRIVSGQVYSINNGSGHYRPTAQSISLAEKAFQDVGVPVRPGAARPITAR